MLDGDPACPHGKGHSSPHFWAHVYCGQRSPISAALVERINAGGHKADRLERQKANSPMLVLVLGRTYFAVSVNIQLYLLSDAETEKTQSVKDCCPL